MPEQTSFDIDDARDLLKNLQQFEETRREEWNRVLNQWGNLKSAWHDQQFDKFEPLFEKLTATYRDAERECEGYIAFMNEQIKIAEERQQRLGNLQGL